MKTLITTGCSYTSNNYPTWNLWLGEHYDKHFTFGQSGSGPKYSYIQIRDYFKYSKNINPQDHHVIIQWSSLLREDRRGNNMQFKSGGQITNNHYYPTEYVEKYFNIVDSTCDLVYYIESLISLSKELGFKLNMLYMFEPWVDTLYGEPTAHPNDKTFFKNQHHQFLNSPYLSSLKELYKSEYFISPSIEKFCFDFPKQNPIYYHDYNNNEYHIDNHPSPLQHFEYYKFLADKFIKDPYPKEWGNIALKLENVMSSVDLSKKFCDIFEKDFHYMQSIDLWKYFYKNPFIYNIDFVKGLLNKI